MHTVLVYIELRVCASKQASLRDVTKVNTAAPSLPVLYLFPPRCFSVQVNVILGQSDIWKHILALSS